MRKKRISKDNHNRTYRVTVDKDRLQIELVVEAYTKDEAEDIAMNKSSSYTRPDGSR